ncbi:FG-GAP-like repeat-containing protein [Labrenzia sp. PHM005]|uniref:FG-GAP-like repeat-containing protein n=1 Tax=Labrenzia sp. PHM005 TaxID=2590016 RepID=UPI0011402AE0|nr:FG-GAP-like repeat-containing protein [Labrenzia sp. PHM005]QDG76920.1 VCBS repeat-containing protein [Labrenzia sp. PHM005]
MVTATIDEVTTGTDIQPGNSGSILDQIINTNGAILVGSSASGGYSSPLDMSFDAYRTALDAGKQYLVQLTINGVANDATNAATFSLRDASTGNSHGSFDSTYPYFYRPDTNGSTTWTQASYRWYTDGSSPYLTPIIVVEPRGVTAGYTLTLTDTTVPVVTAVSASTLGSQDETTLLRDAPGTVSDTMATIVVSDTIYGSVQGSSDVDVYRLNVEAGKEYVIELKKSDVGNTFESTDTFLTLKDANNNNLSFSTSSGDANTLERVTFTATSTETIYISNTFQTGDGNTPDAQGQVAYYRLNVTETGGTTDPTTPTVSLDAVDDQFNISVASGSTTTSRQLDIAFGNWSSNPNTVFLNSDSTPGVFTNSGQSLGSSSSWSIASADINGDGFDDLVYASDQSGQPVVALNDGDGTFTLQSGVLSQTNDRIVQLGDINADGNIDLLVGGIDANAVRVYLGLGNGSFNTSSTIQVPVAAGSLEAALADVDADGDLDVVTANFQGNGNGIYLFDSGSNTFSASTATLGTLASRDVVLADVDGDGDLDAALAPYTADVPNQVWLSNAANKGSGDPLAFTQSSSAQVGSQARNLQFADMNNDGRADLVTVSGGATVEVHINNGSGSFTQAFSTVSGSSSDQFYGLAVADLDGDGDMDVATGNDTGNNYVWTNNGSGALAQAQTLTGAKADSVTIGNFDGQTTNSVGGTVTVRQLDVLANDPRPDTASLQITALGSSTSSLGAALSIVNGEISYDPTNVSSITALTAGQTLTDTFSYTASDGNGTTDSATVTITLSGASGSSISGENTSVQEIYRFFNSATGTHFFTASVAERDNIISTLPQFSFEGNAFDSDATQANGGTAVHRFFNTATGNHFYTANNDEYLNILNNLSQFNYEGIVYYAYSSSNNSNTEFYRFYNTQTGSHFYTASASERDNIINTLSHFNYEGVAYYVDIA